MDFIKTDSLLKIDGIDGITLAGTAGIASDAGITPVMLPLTA